MNEGELLKRLASTIKQQVAPQVAEEFARTQAYMSAVVLEKLGKQLALAPAHQQAQALEFERLLAALKTVKPAHCPAAVNDALTTVEQQRNKAALCALID